MSTKDKETKPVEKQISLKLDLDTYNDVRSLSFLLDISIGATVASIVTGYFASDEIQAKIAPIKNTLTRGVKTEPASSESPVEYPAVGSMVFPASGQNTTQDSEEFVYQVKS